MKKKTLLVSALSVFLLALSACELTAPNSSQAPAPESSSAETSQTSSEASASQSAESSSEEASSSDSGPSSSQTPAADTYTITFNANGGTGTMASVSKQDGEKYTLPTCTFTKEGYHFDYWLVGTSATPREVGYEFTVYANLTVKVMWAEDEPEPGPEPGEKTLTSIDVVNTKAEYEVGDDFDEDSLTVTANYSDESQEVLAKDKYTVTGFDSSAVAAIQELTVTVKDSTVSKNITISIIAPAKTLVSIDIVNTKTEYEVGESFVAESLTVTANYLDASYEVLAASAYEVTGFDSSVAVAYQQLTVTVKGTTVSKNTTISIVAPAPKTLVSIDVTNAKEQYTVGDVFDKSQLTVTANYSDESHETLAASAYTVTGFDSSVAVANQQLTITVNDTTVSKNITISIVNAPVYVYKVTCNGAEATLTDASTEDHEPGDEWDAQWKANIVLTSYQGVVFEVNETPIDIAEVSGNLLFDSEVLKAKTSIQSTVYLKHYANGDYKAWASYDEINYYIIGQINNWVCGQHVLQAGTKTNTEEGNGVEAEKEPGKPQYFIKDVVVPEGNLNFKFEKYTTYYPAGENIVFPSAGTYDIYFVPAGDVYEWGGSFYYLAKHPEVTGLNASYTGVNIENNHKITGTISLQLTYDVGDPTDLANNATGVTYSFTGHEGLTYAELMDLNMTLTNPSSEYEDIEITVNYGDYSDTFEVRVVKESNPATEVELNVTEKALYTGDNFNLVATVTPSSGCTDIAVWSSDDPETVSVTQEGVITALKAGNATITVTLNATVHASCEVAVTDKVYEVYFGGVKQALTSRASVGENHAIYDFRAAKDTVVRVKYGDDYLLNELTDLEAPDRTSYSIPTAGYYVLYVNNKGTNGQVWMSYQTYCFTVNGVIDPSPTPRVDPGESNQATYDAVLASGKTVAVYIGANTDPQNFYHWDHEQDKAVSEGASLTTTVAGNYTFYINLDGKIYYSVPHEYSVKINNAAMDPQPTSRTTLNGNQAIYDLNLTAGQKLKIDYDGDNHCTIGPTAGGILEYTAPRDGAYVVYVNSSNEVYIEEPLFATTTYRFVTDIVPPEGYYIFVHSWSDAGSRTCYPVGTTDKTIGIIENATGYKISISTSNTESNSYPTGEDDDYATVDMTNFLGDTIEYYLESTTYKSRCTWNSTVSVYNGLIGYKNNGQESFTAMNCGSIEESYGVYYRQFTYVNESVTTTSTVTFGRKNNLEVYEAITANITLENAEAMIPYISLTNGVFSFLTAGSVTLYVKVGVTNVVVWANFTPAVPVGVTYTVTSVPSWVSNDGCKVFAWVWSGSNPGSWVSCNLAGTTLTFNTTEEINGFNLARCHSGTETPNWTATGDVAGRVYNKTGDFTCSSGVHSYACLDWVNYSYSPS